MKEEQIGVSIFKLGQRFTPPFYWACSLLSGRSGRILDPVTCPLISDYFAAAETVPEQLSPSPLYAQTL